MDLSHPLTTLLPAADAGALAVLAATEAPLTGRRIAELAGERSHTSTQRALNRLAEQGVVHVQDAGRAKLYVLNRAHVLAPAILEIAGSAETVRTRLSTAIADWEVPCLHASLYGSSARGEAHSGSDLDILVVRPDRLNPEEQEIWEAQLATLEERAFEWTGNPLSWLETSRNDLSRAKAAGEPIFQSWQDDAILLVGTPIAALLRPSSRKQSA